MAPTVLRIFLKIIPVDSVQPGYDLDFYKSSCCLRGTILKLGVDKSVVKVYEQIKEALDTLMKKYTSETCDFHF